MKNLDDLVKMDGVVFACEFSADGRCKDFKSGMDISGDMADKACEYIATVSMLFKTLAGSFTDISKMNWVPMHTWTYSGGDWTVVTGRNHALFVETGKADLNQLHRELSVEEAEERVSQSM